MSDAALILCGCAAVVVSVFFGVAYGNKNVKPQDKPRPQDDGGVDCAMTTAATITLPPIDPGIY